MDKTPQTTQDEPRKAEVGVYDSDGDLILHVGPKVARFRVCSRTLARSSPVFKRMLYGNFAESKPSDGTEWIVKLPEDGAKAMATFLSITHGKFHATPQTLPLRELYDLLTLTEKYDATALLRPFAHAWIGAVSHKTDDPYLVCVAWELGHIELFEKMMLAITRDCTVGKDGMILYGSQANECSSCTSEAIVYLDPDMKPELPCSSGVDAMPQRATDLNKSCNFALDSILHLQPDNMIETIKKNRLVLVQEYLKPYLTTFDALVKGRCTLDLGRREHMTSAEEHSACDSMALGSLFKAFETFGHNITIPGVAHRYNGSFSNLESHLLRIKVLSHHFDCLKDFATELKKGNERALEKSKSLELITPKQLDYLNAQAAKVGFPTKSIDRKVDLIRKAQEEVQVLLRWMELHGTDIQASFDSVEPAVLSWQ